MNPLTQAIYDFTKIARADGARVVFVSGAQGAGKTTSVNTIAKDNTRIAVLGLDDFYLPKKERLQLADAVSPLFATRGPPGTHDVELLKNRISALLNADASEGVIVPTFSKIKDDRNPQSEWQSIQGDPELILIEGWMLGVNALGSSEERVPDNIVERMDESGAWRDFQYEQLSGPYQTLWDQADVYCHIVAPNFQAVETWRIQQEETTLGLAPNTLPDARRAWVKQFIMFYERLTRRMIDGYCRPGHRIPIDLARQPIKPLLSSAQLSNP